MNRPQHASLRHEAGPLAFFVYSNLFIAACAILMVYQTCDLLLDSPPETSLSAFVFFATICSYSFHWYLSPDIEQDSPRLRWLKKNRVVHIILFMAGFAGSVYCGILLRDHWLWLLPAILATFLYSAPKIPSPFFRQLRKIAYGKTIFLAFVWMYVTTILPLIASEKQWRPDFNLLAASRFFFIYSICILFDYRDRDYDRAIGIRSLITWLNQKAIFILFSASLIIFAVLTILLHFYGYSYIIIGILLFPGLITAALYKKATGNFSDMLYYFILDGLMALSSILTLLPGI